MFGIVKIYSPTLKLFTTYMEDSYCGENLISQSTSKASPGLLPLTSGVYRDVNRSRDSNFWRGQFTMRRTGKIVRRKTSGKNIYRIRK